MQNIVIHHVHLAQALAKVIGSINAALALGGKVFCSVFTNFFLRNLEIFQVEIECDTANVDFFGDGKIGRNPPY